MFMEVKDAERLKKQNKKLRKMYELEREKSVGQEQLAKIQNAYIAILLQKLGATEESPVTISGEEVKETLDKDIVRVGMADKGAWKFYLE